MLTIFGEVQLQCSANLLRKKLLCYNVIFHLQPIDIFVHGIWQLQARRYRKLFRLYSRKEKTACFAIFKYSNQPMGSAKIGIELGTKHDIYLKLASFTQKNDILTGFQVFSITCKCLFYRRDFNAKGGPHGTKF